MAEPFISSREPVNYPGLITIDYRALLQPIPGPSPVGENLRYCDVYDQIEIARWQDNKLPLDGGQTQIKTADWRQVEQLCRQALQYKTKDLQIAVWLVQAWLRLYGIAGLYHGFMLLDGLVEVFWAQLHPQGVELEEKIAPLEWLQNKLPEDLLSLMVTLRNNGKNFTAAHWYDCQEPSNVVGTPKGEPINNMKELVNKVTQAMSETNVEFYAQQQNYVINCKKALHELEKKLQKKIPQTDCIDFGQFIRDLEKIAGIFVQGVALHEKKQGEQQLKRLNEFKAPPVEETKNNEGEMIAKLLLNSAEKPQEVANSLPESNNLKVQENAATTTPQTTAQTTAQNKPDKKEPTLVINNCQHAYSLIDEACQYLHQQQPHDPLPQILRYLIQMQLQLPSRKAGN